MSTVSPPKATAAPAAETTPIRTCGFVFTTAEIAQLHADQAVLLAQLDCRPSSIPGSTSKRVIRKNAEAGAAKVRQFKLQLPSRSNPIALIVSNGSNALVEALDAKMGATGWETHVISNAPDIGDVRQTMASQFADVVVLHHSLGRQLVSEICRAMRADRPAAFVFLIKPTTDARWEKITDDEFADVCSPSDILSVVNPRLGIPAAA